MSRKTYDSSEARGRVPVSARQSVHGMPLVVRALGGVEPEGTHLERRKKLETSSQERYTSADIWPFCVQAQAAEDVLEWLQPSGRRPEGCCCSTELSGGRGRLPEATGYRHRRTMHAPCTLRLALSEHSARLQSDRHESFDHTCWIAVKRCSTSASMCGSRAAQREQRSGDGEGRDCSPPRSAAVL